MEGCIEHQGCLTEKGYGKIMIAGKNYYAHRLSYCKANGIDIAEIAGQVVMHKCDNPSCVNPEHLLLGTQSDNMEDMTTKGRRTKGDNHLNSKLTEEIAKEIKKRYAAGGITQTAMSREYGVSVTTINNVVRGYLWRHV